MNSRTAIIAAATSFGMVAGTVPAAAVDARAAEVIKDVAYAPAQPATSKGHLLDLYLPAGGEARPLVLWTAGSAWQRDDGKSRADGFASVFNAKGYAVAGVSIRSSSQAQFPAQVHDLKAAIRFLRANAAKYRLDPKRFAYMGDSSGGWTSQMATLTGGVAALEGTVGTTGQPSDVQAGVAFYGVSDLNRMRGGGNSPEEKLLGCALSACKDNATQASPITHVDKSDPPLLLLHGQSDSLVDHEQSVVLHQALKTSCRESQFISVPGANHNMSDVMNPSRFGKQTVYTASNCNEVVSKGSPNPTWDHIIGFLNTALGAGAARTNDPS